MISTAGTSRTSSRVAAPLTYPTTSIRTGASQASARCPPGPRSTLPSPEMTTSDASVTTGVAGQPTAPKVQTTHQTRREGTISTKMSLSLYLSQRIKKKTLSLSQKMMKRTRMTSQCLTRNLTSGRHGRRFRKSVPLLTTRARATHAPYTRSTASLTSSRIKSRSSSRLLFNTGLLLNDSDALFPREIGEILSLNDLYQSLSKILIFTLIFW